MSKLRIFFAVVFAVVCVSLAAADTHYVSANGPNDPGTGRPEDPFRRIQDAINAAVAHDIVEISPGIYTGPGNYNLDTHGKSIIIRSTDPENPDVVAATVIDPNGAGRGFYIHSGEDANCSISGIKIRKGLTNTRGGGMLCENSSPTINGCLISGNSASLSGGGIYCNNSSPQIMGCLISGNEAQDAGGVGCWWNSSPRIKNCVISGNQTWGFFGGGGLECGGNSNIRITNCTLAGNVTTGYGGAVRCEESQLIIKDSILWGNTAVEGPQLALESFGSPCDALVSYGDLQGEEAAVYKDAGSVLTWGSGNMNTDPCFASFESAGDPNLWDFHLQSTFGRWDQNAKGWVKDTNTSPCIDAGDPNSGWSSEPWPNGKRINMGACGGTNQASKNGNLADFDLSGLVDFVDFADFSSYWLKEETCIEDLDGSGTVDFADLKLFVENWLWQR